MWALTTGCATNSASAAAVRLWRSTTSRNTRSLSVVRFGRVAYGERRVRGMLGASYTQKAIARVITTYWPQSTGMPTIGSSKGECPMTHRSLGECIEAADAVGEVLNVPGADLRRDVGCLTELAAE